MAFTLPTSPTNGQVATQGNITFTYNSTSGSWQGTPSTGASNTGNYAQLFSSSGTFTIPTGVKSLKVSVVAGGATGTNGYYSGGQNSLAYSGTTGAPGGSCIGWYNLTGSSTTTISVVVGGPSLASSTSGTGLATFSATGAGGIGSGGTLNIKGNGALFGAYGNGGAGGTPPSEFDGGTPGAAGSPGAVLFEW